MITGTKNFYQVIGVRASTKIGNKVATQAWHWNNEHT